jgi:hypothetical protein
LAIATEAALAVASAGTAFWDFKNDWPAILQNLTVAA